MKKHLLLTGFSCTGKTTLGQKAFANASIIDSDDVLLDWIADRTGNRFSNIYTLFITLGRDKALTSITEAERALIAKWAEDSNGKVISLGPGFPLHDNWPELRAVSHVVLLRRSAASIYDSFMSRRKEIFDKCPVAKNHDNWDIGVIVDEHRMEYPRKVAIRNIERLLVEREARYSNNDLDLNTDNRVSAAEKLREFGAVFICNLKAEAK